MTRAPSAAGAVIRIGMGSSINPKTDFEPLIHAHERCSRGNNTGFRGNKTSPRLPGTTSSISARLAPISGFNFRIKRYGNID